MQRTEEAERTCCWGTKEWTVWGSAFLLNNFSFLHRGHRSSDLCLTSFSPLCHTDHVFNLTAICLRVQQKAFLQDPPEDAANSYSIECYFRFASVLHPPRVGPRHKRTKRLLGAPWQILYFRSLKYICDFSTL